jgi:predicted nucleic-acid-binding protein
MTRPPSPIALDTNVLVRYLAQDDARQSALATTLIEQTLDADQPGFISIVALLETVWVMESCYQADAKVVADILRDLLETRPLEVQDHAAVRVAAQRYAQGRVDLHDCLIHALAGQRQARVVTFDAKAARRLGMTLLA